MMGANNVVGQTNMVVWAGQTAFSLLAGNQKLFGWLVGTPDILQRACTLHPNQVAYNIYVTASPYFGKNEATDSLQPEFSHGLMPLMIAGSSSCLYCLKVLSREEEKKEVSLRKSSLASAAEEGCCCWKMLQGKALHRNETFSLQQLLKPETKQLSPTHLYSECSQKCPKTITQILQPGRQEYLAKMENLNQAWYKHLCGVQLQLNLCRPVSQNIFAMNLSNILSEGGKWYYDQAF